MNVQHTVLPTESWTGTHYINLIDPDPEHMVLDEIAGALSRQPRYNGLGTTVPFNTAKHSILVFRLAREDGITGSRDLRTLLMHDAPEAYLGDAVSPLKCMLPDYRAIEDNFWSVMVEAFDLRDTPVQRDVTRFYDLLALSTEKAALISPRAGEWPGLPAPRPMPQDILNASDAASKLSFLTIARSSGLREVGRLARG